MSVNIETVQRMYAAFGRGDITGLLDDLAENIEWEHDWGSEPPKWFVPRRGRAAVPGFFQDLTDFEFEQFEPVGFLEGDNMVAVPVRLKGRVKSTGKTIQDLEVHLWTFGPDGKATRLRHCIDTRQFADAIGG